MDSGLGQGRSEAHAGERGGVEAEQLTPNHKSDRATPKGANRSSWDLIPDWVTTTLMVAAIVLVLGLFFALVPQSNSFTSSARGTVSRVEKHRKTFVTFVRFEDSDHRVFEAQSIINSSSRYNVGDVLTIRYDPQDPGAGCLIEGDEADSLFARVFGLVFRIAGGAGVFFAVGAGLYFRYLRHEPE